MYGKVSYLLLFTFIYTMPIEGTFIDKVQQQRDIQNGITDLEKNELTTLFEKESTLDWKTFCSWVNKWFIDYHNQNKNDESMKRKTLDTLGLFVIISWVLKNKWIGGPSAKELTNPEKLCEIFSSAMKEQYPGQDSYEEIFLMELFMMTDPEFSSTQQSLEEWKLDGKLDNVFKSKLTAYMSYLSTSKRLDPSNFSSSLGSLWNKKRWNALTLWIISSNEEDQPATMKVWYETTVKLWKKTQVSVQSNIQSPVWDTNQQSEQQYWSQQANTNIAQKELVWWVWFQITNQHIWTYGTEYINWKEWSSMTIRWNKIFKTSDTWSVMFSASHTLTKWDNNVSWKVFASNVTFQQSVGKWNISVQWQFTQSNQINEYMFNKNKVYGWNIAYINSKSWTTVNVWVTHNEDITIPDRENQSIMIKEATTTGIFSAQQTVTKWEGWNITIWGNLKVKKWWSTANTTSPISWDATIRVEF